MKFRMVANNKKVTISLMIIREFLLLLCMTERSNKNIRRVKLYCNKGYCY